MSNSLPSPFKFLDSYQPSDRDIFFGRDEDIEALYQKVHNSSLILVYGLSGSGKTSLVQCGLSSRFDGPDWHPIYIRRGENINRSFHAELLHALDDSDRDHWSISELTQAIFRKYLRPVYLIFDQFEEVFTLENIKDEHSRVLHEKERNDLFMSLQDLLGRNIPCKILIIMREEYIGQLYKAEEIFPTIFDFRLRVEALQNTEEVIVKNFEKFQINCAATTLKKIKDNIINAQANSQLAFLQVYLDALWDNAEVPDGETVNITSGTLETVGEVSDALERYLSERVKNLAKDQSLDEAEIYKLLSYFITPEATKQPVAYTIEGDDDPIWVAPQIWLGNVTQVTVDRCLRELVRSRLLRVEKSYLEIGHDALGKIIDAKLSAQDRLLKDLEQIFKSSQKVGGYLNEVSLELYDRFESKIRVSDEILENIERSRVYHKKVKRNNRILRTVLWATSILAIIGLVVTLFFFRKVNNAKILAQEALTRSEETLSKIYFYSDSFGLAYDKFKNKYGFIDKNLNTKIPFNYDDAEPFNEYSGLAQVKKGTSTMLLNTDGAEYPLISAVHALDSNALALDLSNGDFDNVPAKVFKNTQLRILFLNNTRIRSLPVDIGNLTNLEYFQAVSKTRILLPAEIGKLTRLRFLFISPLNVPREIGGLHQLEKLNLDGNSSSKTLPGEIGDLTSLKELYIRNFDSLVSLPGGIGRIGNLEKLYLVHNRELKNFPQEIATLAKLKELYSKDHAKLELSDIDLSGLKSLEKIDFRRNDKLTTLPKNFDKLSNLKYVTLIDNVNLNAIPQGLGKLKNLEKLILLGLHSLKTLPADIGDIESLLDLTIINNKNLSSLPSDIRRLKSLRRLIIESNDKLEFVPSLSELDSLRELSLKNVKNLNINEISSLSSLRSLTLVETNLDEQEIRRLHNKLPDCSIFYRISGKWKLLRPR